MHLSAMLFVVTVIGLGAAVGHSSMQERTPRHLAEPGTQDDGRSSQVRVYLPPIEPMDHYYGSEDDSWAWFNPFIPPDNRESERQALAQRLQVPEQPEWRETPPPPVSITPPSKPSLPNIPAQALEQTQRPVVMGALLRRHRASVLVAYDDSFHIVSVGDSVGPWTLERVNANEAWMTLATQSRPQRFAIRTETAMVLEQLAGTDTVQASSSETGSLRGGAGSQADSSQGDPGSGRSGTARRATPRRPQDRQGGSSGLPDGIDLNDPEVQRILQGLPPHIRRFVEQDPEGAWRMWQNMQGGR